MAYSTCKIKNISGGDLTLIGQLYSDDEMIAIADVDRIAHATSDAVCDAIVADDIVIHDSEGSIAGHAAQIATYRIIKMAREPYDTNNRAKTLARKHEEVIKTLETIIAALEQRATDLENRMSNAEDRLPDRPQAGPSN